MKKISILMMAAVAACGLMTSCKSDTQPRLDSPKKFVLNNPALAEQTYILRAAGEGDEATSTTIELTVSQPDYGVGVVTQYQPQVSLTGIFDDAILNDNGDVETPATYTNIRTVDTQAKISISAFDMSVAVNELNGIKDMDQEDYFNEHFANKPQKVYVRVLAYIPNADYSRIYSNVIELNVIPYFAVAVPGNIWMIGAYTGWNVVSGHGDSSPLVLLYEPENAIGSKIYSATIDIEAGANPGAFRFYTALGDWETNSIGSQVEDAGVNVSIDPDTKTYEGEAVDGKGNWNLSNWDDITGGEAAQLKMTVDLSGNAYKVYFTVLQ